MQRALLAVAMVLVGAMSCAADSDRGAQFRIPEGWLVSPHNNKPEGQAGYRILHPASGIEFVYVPGGAFMMGASDDREDDHKPVHEVQLTAYWIGLTEVTVAQWRKVMGELPLADDGTVWNDQGEDHPVVTRTWHECQQFCKRIGLRLPTEAEWEYAARGPDGRNYPWGSEWDEMKCCNSKKRGPGGRTFPVESFPQGATWCGALDMAGNVMEWCADWYGRDYYAKSPRLNPQGPSEEEATKGMITFVPSGVTARIAPTKVHRDEGWNSNSPSYFRCTYRGSASPSGYVMDGTGRFSVIGFRCAYRAE